MSVFGSKKTTCLRIEPSIQMTSTASQSPDALDRRLLDRKTSDCETEGRVRGNTSTVAMLYSLESRGMQEQNILRFRISISRKFTRPLIQEHYVGPDRKYIVFVPWVVAILMKGNDVRLC